MFKGEYKTFSKIALPEIACTQQQKQQTIGWKMTTGICREKTRELLNRCLRLRFLPSTISRELTHPPAKKIFTSNTLTGSP